MRTKIDRLDARLVKLLNARAACAVEIGRRKAARSLPIRDQERERAVLQTVLALNAGPLSPRALKRIYRAVFDGCKEIQRQGGGKS
jgi:chorismate mutase